MHSKGIIATPFAVLLTYLALYLASPIVTSPFIAYWANAKPTMLKPIINTPMLITYLTSPFNAYEAKIIRTNPLRLYMTGVLAPTVLLTAITVIVKFTEDEGVTHGKVVSDAFLLHSSALAFVASYATSLIIWLIYGKPSIGISIYTEYTLASTAYATILTTHASIKRLKKTGNSRMRTTKAPTYTALLTYLYLALVMALLILLALVTFLTVRILPPTVPHMVGLTFTITMLMEYHKQMHRHNKNKTLVPGPGFEPGSSRL